MNERPIVVLLGDRSAATAAVFNALTEGLADRAEVRAILEAPQSRVALARKRARRLGWRNVAGQIAFVQLIVPVLRRSARRRLVEIAHLYGLDLRPVPSGEMVSSINDAETITLLEKEDPAIVVVHGTSVINREVLDCLHVPVLNVHAGVTPRYRGVHGGYWALRDDRPELAGSTVHLVDTGIDTGGILAQATFTPHRSDTFATYPLLQLACALPMLLTQVDRVLSGGVPQTVPPLPGAEHSELRSHPTAWNYLWARMRSGVR